MLTTEELHFAVHDLISDESKGDSREERREKRIQNNIKISELEEQWKEHLRSTYLLPSIDEKVANLIFSKACEDGHAYGYQEVEYQYAEYAESVSQILDNA